MPLDALTRIPEPPDLLQLAIALADASAAIARLDQALTLHPLAPALLYRTRLLAVQAQAAADGVGIDPWQLAATIEGLRLKMDPFLRIIDRGEIFDRARRALDLHQWLVGPDFYQEGEVQRAEAQLAAQPAELPALLAAATGFREWIEAGEARPAMRAALVRYWGKRHLLRMPIPLTGAPALAAGQDWEPNAWQVNFLRAVTREAEAALDLLHWLERDWFEARRNLARRRNGAHDAAAVDVLAAAPAISATTLARILKIAIKNAIRILDDLVKTEIAIEITHRSKRRLFGLKNLAPLRDEIRPPYRPGHGPGRGQYPRFLVETDEPEPALPPAPLSPVERRAFDYTALEEAMSGLDDVVRQARGRLSVFVSGK